MRKIYEVVTRILLHLPCHCKELATRQSLSFFHYTNDKITAAVITFASLAAIVMNNTLL